MNLGLGIDAIESSTTIEELKRKLQLIIEGFGFAAFSFVDAGRPHLDIPFHFGTTGEKWESLYHLNSFIHVDPMISKARRTNTPFTWGKVDLPQRTGKHKPRSHVLMEAARDHGFKNGYVFPFHFVDKQGRIYSTVNGLFWKDEASRLNFLLSQPLKHELDLLLLYWTQRAIDIAGPIYRNQSQFGTSHAEGKKDANLSDREREVLTWAGRGLTVVDTGEVLKIGDETVQSHIRNAIAKLGATNKTHAVAKAIHLALIDL
jgi:LuxR family transcriptional regulator, quorum-sensing system regulator BjaR1